MITEQDLQEAIAECEGQRNPTANTCMKLAAFYTIRDKMFPKESEDIVDSIPDQPVFYSRATGYSSDSEFGRLVKELDMNKVLSVIDELMDTLKMLNPRLYAGVIRRLDNDA